MNNKIHDFNGFQIKLVGVVVIFSVGGGTRDTPVAERVKVGMSPVCECENVFYTYSIVGRVKVGMSPVCECENVFYTYSIVGRVKVGMSPVSECENVFYTYRQYSWEGEGGDVITCS